MDQLPDSLLLQILSRLDDSADVARCRVASKAFNSLLPELRSINLRYSLKWYLNSSPPYIKPNRMVLLDLLSKQRVVESVSIGDESPFFQMPPGVDPWSDDFYLIGRDFAIEWLPRVSESLKSLSISDLCYPSKRQSKILPLISEYCHNLRNLTLKAAWLFVDTLNPMPMLTSLTLSSTRLEDENLNKLNKCFPNLQVLNFEGLAGLKDPKIHLLNLKTCCFSVRDDLQSLTLITPSLITLTVRCTKLTTFHVEAPMLSHFELCLYILINTVSVTIKNFENLKTLWIKSCYIGSLLSRFPITKTVADLTLDELRAGVSKLTLAKVFTVFPNVSSLCVNHGAWSELETCLNPEDWEILDGRTGLKTFCAYLKLVDPSLTFSSVARVLDQFVGLAEVSLLTYGAVPDRSKSFMSKCMARWPGLKWRWGIWNGNKEEFLDNQWCI